MKFVGLFVLIISCLTALVVSDADADGRDGAVDWVRLNPEIYSLHINSLVYHRFATTNVTCQLANTAAHAKEAVFYFILPKEAFITHFSMEIDGKSYSGDVKEKVAAKKQYERAKQRGQSAGQVAKQSRESNVFRVSVNVANESKVEFNLTYQEFLRRRLGLYNHVININPGQAVGDLRVDVEIVESRDITALKVPPIRKNIMNEIEDQQENPLARITRTGTNRAHVQFRPSVQDQLSSSALGIEGQFVVRYDVERDLDSGEIQVVDGYFVHYFAPSGLTPLSKNVMFILDVSGSMSGVKLQQVKQAMKTILADLREQDRFGVIKFSGYFQFWQPDGLVPVTPDNIKKAKQFIKTMNAGGSTNINDALLQGLTQLTDQKASPDYVTRSAMVIFLTDGQPTAGIVSPAKIISNFNSRNKGKVTLFSLGFGENPDFSFLQKISLQNRGFARKLYEDSDASLQLQGFYNEVSTPVLSDVKFEYLNDVMDDDTMTSSDFYTFYKGSELVVAGKLKDNRIDNINTKVSAQSADGKVAIEGSARISSHRMRPELSKFTERMWAYLTIKELLNKMVESVNKTVREHSKEKALQLSLKYGFVTPLTSMVVTKPEEPNKNAGEFSDQDIPEDESNSKDYRQKGGRRGYSAPPSSRPSHRRRGPSRSFADNDPHVLVKVKGVEEHVCFDVIGKQGQVFQLLNDPHTGTIVNGKIVSEARLDPNKTPRTYFGTIMIMYNGAMLKISPYKVTIANRMYRWSKLTDIQMGHFELNVTDSNTLTIQLRPGIVFSVIRHRRKKRNPNKVDFLGFYIEEGATLSNLTRGLIGEFQHQYGTLTDNLQIDESGKIRTNVVFSGPNMPDRSLTVTMGHRRNMQTKELITCWHVYNNGRGLLLHKHGKYVVPSMKYTKMIIEGAG